MVGSCQTLALKTGEKIRDSWKMKMKKTFSARFFLKGGPLKCYLFHPILEEFCLEAKNPLFKFLICVMEK